MTVTVCYIRLGMIQFGSSARLSLSLLDYQTRSDTMHAIELALGENMGGTDNVQAAIQVSVQQNKITWD